MDILHLIGGHLVAGDGAPQEILDPATGAQIAAISEASSLQVDAAVRAAQTAFATWSRATPQFRSKLLLQSADRIERGAAELARLESLNCGKLLRLVREDELPATVDAVRFFAGAARCLCGPAAGEYLDGFTSMVRRDPIGVIAAIAPWNYPLMTAIWKLAPILAAGNTVVLKPSELTPLTTLRLAAILAEIFPPGVLNIVSGRGQTSGVALIEHPSVHMIALTGGTATGTRVLKAAATGLKRSHLELGSKSPAIILKDACVDLVAQAIRHAGYYNAGQDCTAPCRLLVERPIYAKVVDALGAAVSTIRIGHPTSPETELGPLISAAHLKVVLAATERAAAATHISVVTGGRATSVGGRGFYFEPTVLAGVRCEDEISQLELFGPVVSVTAVDGPEEAIALANASDKGLASSVWTENQPLAMQAAAQLRYGCTWINAHLPLANEMPHGGLKASGYGKDLSMQSLEDYTVARHVMVRL